MSHVIMHIKCHKNHTEFNNSMYFMCPYLRFVLYNCELKPEVVRLYHAIFCLKFMRISSSFMPPPPSCCSPSFLINGCYEDKLEPANKQNTHTLHTGHFCVPVAHQRDIDA